LHILGPTDEVKQFDKARKRVKDFPSDGFHRQQYYKISAVIETRVSRAERNTKEQLKSWERQHFVKTGQISTSNDMLADPSAKVLVDRLKYCKAIGKELRKEKCL
jgi:hypothetical protein